jgi:cytoskeletal protein RodZ
MSFSEQQLKRIGESLSQIRIEQNLTLENVAAKTFISKRVLVAIEQGNVRELPEPFYTEALIAKYAQAIGASQVLDEEKTTSEVEESELQQAVLKQKVEPNKPNNQKLPTFQLKSSHLYLIYLVLVILAVRAIAVWIENPVVFDSSKSSEEKVSLDNKTSIDNSTSTTISSASPSQFISQSNSNNSDSVVVDISLKDRCWLKVVVDGKVEFEGTLAQGTQKRWTGREQINIIAGNAGGVVITYNNGQEKLLGKPGQVEEVTYTVN